MLRRQDRIDSWLDRIEGALVPHAEVKAIERRVGRLENHLSRGAWSVIGLFLAGLAAAVGWLRAARHARDGEALQRDLVWARFNC